jgi:hypothetical protein
MPGQQGKKWDPTNRKLVHIGYNEESRAYCILHLVMAKILKARDVIFFEDQKSNSKKRNHLQRQQN